MGSRDLVQLVVAAIPVAALLLSAALFPVYQLPDGSVVRKPIWAPATIPVGHGEDRLTPADLERLNKDPRQREIIESMRALPREVALAPRFISGRGFGPRNLLGDLALFSLIGWAIFAWFKWNR